MIAAVDINILLDILRPNEDFPAGSSAALEASAHAGSLVLSDIGYAERCCLTREAHFLANRPPVC